MKKYLGYVIAAAVCLALGLFLKFALIGYSFVAYGLFAAALVILCYLGLRLLLPKCEKLSRTLNRILTYGLILFIVALAVTEGCLINEARSERDTAAEYAIVLGAGVNGTTPSRSLLARLETALTYAEENPETVIVVSGGQGPGEDITEAECMYQWLTQRGVPAERVLMEDKSESTEENIRFSRETILAYDPDFSGKVCIVTEGYHLLRARIIAMDNGMEHVMAVSAYNGLPVLTANYYFREAFAFWYYMLTR